MQTKLPGAVDGACFHCALPVPVGSRYVVRIDAVERSMCCAGCAAVAQTIVDTGLTAYYRHRTSVAGLAGETLPDVVRARSRQPAVSTAVLDEDGAQEATLLVEGMTCAACAWLIEQRLRRIEGVVAADVNFSTQRARVRWDTARTRCAAILEALISLGYGAQPYTRAAATATRQHQRRGMLWRIFVAGLASMQVMMYSIPVYLSDGDMSADILALMRWAGFVLTLPVLVFSASGFFKGAWRDLRVRQLGMDVPIALGVLTAFAPSAWATFNGGGEVYFDAVSMFVFLLLGGRYLEMLARDRAGDAIERLAQHAPSVAQRLSDYPHGWSTTAVTADALKPGDLILVKPGETIAADGVVLEGDSEVDESLLTGEARPVVKRKEARVVAGAVNRLNVMVVRVTQVGECSTLGQLALLIERALAQKPRILVLAQRAASGFVAAILLLAAVVFFWWLRVDSAQALWVTVAVLVVTCPCALSLATPTALAAATNAATRRGILITQAHVLETAAQVTHIVFDKTGTLTHGRLQLTQVQPLSVLTAQESLALAALVESGSEHPIAQALRAAAPQRSLPHTLANVASTAGAGVQAEVDGLPVRIGGLEFVAQLHGKAPPVVEAIAGETLVALGDEGGWLALFRLRDSLRAEARSAVQRFAELGCRASLLSGDNGVAAADVARRAGINDYAAGQTPGQKLARIEALQRCGAVAMVGDGVNDAPGLSAAALSIAMGAGTDLTRNHADVVLLSNKLQDIPYLIELGRRTRRIIRQNLAWAIGYNALAVPLATLGWVTPWMAGLGMAASSLVVVLNALRLNASAQPAARAQPRTGLQAA